MTSIYNNTEAFGLMSPKKQAEMKRHMRAGGDFLFFDSVTGWSAWAMESLYGGVTYRAARPAEKPMTVAPEVWRVLHPDVRWITFDGDGVFGWHGDRPTFSADRPTFSDGWDGKIHADLDDILAPGLIDPGTCDWTQAIVERPKGGHA